MELFWLLALGTIPSGSCSFLFFSFLFFSFLFFSFLFFSFLFFSFLFFFVFSHIFYITPSYSESISWLELLLLEMQSLWNHPKFQRTLLLLQRSFVTGHFPFALLYSLASEPFELFRYLDPNLIATIEGGVETSTALLAQKFDYIFYTGKPSAFISLLICPKITLLTSVWVNR